jgi:hypothetical protein
VRAESCRGGQGEPYEMKIGLSSVHLTERLLETGRAPQSSPAGILDRNAGVGSPTLGAGPRGCDSCRRPRLSESRTPSICVESPQALWFDRGERLEVAI